MRPFAVNRYKSWATDCLEYGDIPVNPVGQVHVMVLDMCSGRNMTESVPTTLDALPKRCADTQCSKLRHGSLMHRLSSNGSTCAGAAHASSEHTDIVITNPTTAKLLSPCSPLVDLGFFRGGGVTLGTRASEARHPSHPA